MSDGSVVFLKLAGTSGDIDMPALAADVRGEWAAHRNPNGDGWRVSHVPTGRSIRNLADELTHRDAQRIARLIDRAVPALSAIVRDHRAEDGIDVSDDDRRVIEAIVAEVVGS